MSPTPTETENTPVPMSSAPPVVPPTTTTTRNAGWLTPEDTYTMFLDALPGITWGETETQKLTGDLLSDTDPVTAWAEWVTENEPGAQRVLLTHERMLASMQRIADDSTVRLCSEIVEQVRAVLDAVSHEDATDELCQMDVIGFDAVVQVAVLGEVRYG